jgi:ParB family chromosome partitioning protein
MRASLPLHEDNAPADGPREGRRRLAGAFMIELDQIRPDPDQPRRTLDPKALAELTDSVKRLGILQAITVRYVESAKCYRIIAGERRYTAARNAGLTEMPCWVKTPKDEEILLHQIVENWQRSDLNPFELADSLALLQDANRYTQADLAKATGKSKGEVSKLLTILDLDPDVQKIAREDSSGRISKRHLYSLARLPVQNQERVLARVQRDELTALDLERLVSRMEARADKPRKVGAPVFRRRFVTKRATVLFTFRQRDVSDQELLSALADVKTQIKERGGDPVDFADADG